MVLKQKAVALPKIPTLEDRGYAIWDKSNKNIVYQDDVMNGIAILPKEYDVYEPGTTLDNISDVRKVILENVTLFNPK